MATTLVGNSLKEMLRDTKPSDKKSTIVCGKVNDKWKVYQMDKTGHKKDTVAM